MPEAAVAENGAQGRGRGGGGNFLSTAFRLFLFYMLAKNLFGGGGGPAPPPGAGFRPAVTHGDPIAMRAFITESADIDPDNLSVRPDWQELEFALPLAAEKTHSLTYRPSKAVQNNGSLYLHTVFEATVFEKTEDDPIGSPRTLEWTRSWPIIEYFPRPKVAEGVNLLSGKDGDGKETTHEAQKVAAAAPREIVSFLKPNLTVSLIDDQSVIQRTQILPQQQPWIHLDEADSTYVPTVFFNDFWTLRDHMVLMNASVSEVQLHLTLNTLGAWKWMLYLQMDQSFSMQKSMGAMAEGDTDEFKRVLIEGNPYFLGLTFAVSMLHSVFDVLAFKNDIGFWKDKKDVEGLSVKTIFINCICQVIVLLYLLDNDTSFIILASTFVGIGIEFWKITKAMDVTVDRSGPVPRLRFKDKESYNTSRTKQYDEEAMRYLSYALYPLVFGYGVYSLIYQPHKSWWSWVVNTLVGCVYTFGFILMCPQLYLNYKLKSVAHMPMKQHMYKFLNTIIDDLFAFVIKMPTLHRLSVFRDDAVFLVLIYQRWLYPVDKTRANEFGFVAEAPSEAAPAAGEAAGGATSAASGELLSAPPSAPASDTSDDFEDLGKDADTLQLRQRRGGSGADAAASDEPAAAAGGDAKKGR